VKTIKNITYNNLAKGKQANISKFPSPIPPRPNKSFLAKSKFFKNNLTSDLAHEQSYLQASKDNIRDIVKIKKTFPKLSSQKVSEIYKVLNNIKHKDEPKINMMTKGLSRKQIIVLMSMNNAKKSHGKI